MRPRLNGAPPEDLFCGDLPSRPCPGVGTVLVTGASGYIGGRLVPELLFRGYTVRALVRSASPGYQARWPDAQIAVADALRPESLAPALEGVRVAYYLIHSLLLGPRRFAAADIEAARNFRWAAERAGVQRIIYLGGLGDTQGQLSEHLRSRSEVATELRRGNVPVTILRAAVIIGSGSASYELLRNLVQRWRLFPLPRWARTRCQPIAVRDVIKYLVGALETSALNGGAFDIGGADVLSYQRMLAIMADIHRKRIAFVPVPCSLLWLWAYLTSLITPVPAAITRSLFESLENEVVCEADAIRALVPFAPLGYREAIVRAMSREEQDRVHTRWSDAYPPAHELAIKLHEVPYPLAFTAHHRLRTGKSASSLFASICKIGGRDGWFHNNWMWRLRGFVDRLLLGVGSVRGRRSQSSLHLNDVIGFFRVEDLQPDRRLLLRAEMKLPGRAWLEFNIQPADDRNELSVVAYFDTHSRFGRLYWYFFKPFHSLLFEDLLRQIESRSDPWGAKTLPEQP